MNTKLGMLKQAALAICCAAGVGALPLAHADSFGIGYNSGWHHHSGYAVSVGTGPVYGGYYAPGYYGPRCYYDAYGYRRCPGRYYGYPGYYYGGYGPGLSFNYYGGYGRWGHDGWRGGHGGWHGGGHWHDGGGHWHDGGNHWHHGGH